MIQEISTIQFKPAKKMFPQLDLIKKELDIYVFSTSKREHALPILYPLLPNYFCFILVRSGELIIKINSDNYKITKNDLLMLSRQSLRKYVDASDDLEFTIVMFKPDYLSKIGIHYKNLEALEFLSPLVQPILKTNDESFELLHAIASCLSSKIRNRSTNYYRDEITSHMLGSFIYEVSSLFKKQEKITNGGSRKEEITIRFFKLLPKYFKQSRSVTFFAEKLNITPRYLTQTLKAVTGKSAGELIDDIVLLEAKLLLDDLNLSIWNISSELNFSDQFFFSKYFKRICGQTPSQYRQGI